MTTNRTAAAKRITADNGYFEVWMTGSGQTVRVTTEFDQWNRRNRKGYRAEQTAATKARLSAK